MSEEFAEIPAVFRNFQPDWGLVLGSGLGPFVDAIETEASVPFNEVPGLPESRVPGHAGRFVLGRVGGKRMLIAQGRVHLYEGRSAREITAFVRFMSACGAKRLILTNAAGTLNREFAPGGWMMLNDHLNLTGTSPLLGGPNFIDMSEVYSAKLRAHFSATAAEQGMPLHEGVYASLLGPQYETPAEIRMLRVLGAQAVGMSTVPEVIALRHMRVRCAALSCITNMAAGLGAGELDHKEVEETAKARRADLQRLLKGWILKAGRA